MTVSLGHGEVSQVIIHVKNNETFTLFKGQLAKILPTTAITFTETGDPIFAVELSDAADGTAGEGGIALGVTKEDIPPGKTGPVIIWGLAQAITITAVAAGTVWAPHNTGLLQDAAGAAHETPVAINLQASGAAALTWCFVDFISSMTHVLPSAGDTFHGVSY